MEARTAVLPLDVPVIVGLGYQADDVAAEARRPGPMWPSW
jgi:hypothetical protein